MKPFAAIHIVVCLAAVCLIEGWLARNTASASCGDYVMVGEHAVPGSSGHGNHQPPCHGPNCSRRSVPLPEHPANPQSNQQDWGLACDGAPQFAVEAVGVITFHRQPCVLLHADPIFRPPRHAG